MVAIDAAVKVSAHERVPGGVVVIGIGIACLVALPAFFAHQPLSHASLPHPISLTLSQLLHTSTPAVSSSQSRRPGLPEQAIPREHGLESLNARAHANRRA